MHGSYLMLPHTPFCFLNTLQQRYYVINGLPFIDLRLLNACNGCCVGPGQTVRMLTVIAAWCAIDAFTRSCYWCLMQHGATCNFTSSAMLLSKYTVTLMIPTLHWSSLVECMERVPRWPWTNSAYVCSYCCLVCDWPYSLKAVIGVRCSMHGPYVILPHAPFCFPNTPQQ